ncbi:MAG: chemotaxis protein CheW [Gammaproteobacteria bacterium]
MLKETLPPVFAEPQAALTVYLESLLRSAPAAAEPQVIQEPAEAATASTPEPQADHAEPAAFVEGTPAWAQAPFQCLLFKTAGLTLGIPLFKLNGITPWSSDITPMPGHSPAFLGLLPHHGGQVKVIDTAQVVMPKQKSATRHHYIVLIAGGEWGLTCESVSEVVTLHPDQVRWRTPQGIRPWLAGTVKDRMCALLDAGELATLLAARDETARP